MVLYGVPQGSILGPTLFSIYINDLAELVDCELIFYADDTVILDKDPIILQEGLNTIYNWCNNKLLTINCKKSHWMQTEFLHKNENTNIQCKLGDTELTKVSDYRYLGLIIDCQLTFRVHREHMINRVNYKLSYFHKIRKYIVIEAAEMVYKNTILPLFEFVDFVYDYGVKYTNKKLQMMHNQGLYIVYNQHFLPFDEKDSTDILHRRANLHRLIHRRKAHMLSFIFNYRHEICRLDIRNISSKRHDGILFKKNQTNIN